MTTSVKETSQSRDSSDDGSDSSHTSLSSSSPLAILTIDASLKPNYETNQQPITPITPNTPTTPCPLTPRDRNQSTTFAYKHLFLVLITISFCCAWFLSAALSPITDTLQKDWNTTSAGIGLISSMYFVASFVFQLFWGVIVQSLSAEFLSATSSLGVSLFVFLFTISENVATAATMRFFGGGFSAPLYLSGMNFCGQRYKNTFVPIGSSIIYMSSNFVIIAGTLLEAYLVEKYNDWRPVFYAIGSMAFIVSLLTFLSIYCTADTHFREKDVKFKSQISFRSLKHKKTTKHRKTKQNVYKHKNAYT
jgi:MFS family permease